MFSSLGRAAAAVLLVLFAVGPPGAAVVQEASAKARGDPQLAADERVLKEAGYTPDGAGLRRFLEELIPSPDHDGRLQTLVEQLGALDFRTREQALKALLKTGPRALPALRRQRLNADLEIRVRVERCIGALERPLAAAVPASLRLLQNHKPSGAVKLLLDYLPHVADEVIGDEIHVTVVRLFSAGEEDRGVLRAALTGTDATARAAAALALGAAGTQADRLRVRRLLADSEPWVRFRAAQGLGAAGDPAAIPALIDLLGLSGTLCYQAEDVLLQVAGDRAPVVLVDDSPAGRERSRQAWQRWWEARSPDFHARLELAACPSRQARLVVVRFLQALFSGDFAGLQRNASLPFNLVGILTLQRQEEFDQLFREVMEGHKRNRELITFQILKVCGRNEFWRAASAGERQFLERWPAAEIRVVYFRGRFGADGIEDGAVWLRLNGGRARVIGFGRAQQSAAMIPNSQVKVTR